MQFFVLPVSCSSHLDLVLFIILINDLELAWLNFKMIPKLVFPGQLTQQLGAAQSSDLTSLSPLLAVECPRLWLWHFFRLSSLIHWIGRKTSGFIYFCLFVFLEFSTAKGFNWLSRNRGHRGYRQIIRNTQNTVRRFCSYAKVTSCMNTGYRMTS